MSAEVPDNLTITNVDRQIGSKMFADSNQCYFATPCSYVHIASGYAELHQLKKLVIKKHITYLVDILEIT